MTTTTTKFVQPEPGATVTAAVKSTAAMAYEQVVFVTNGGYYRVATPPANLTTVVLENLGYAGNAFPGSEVGGRVVAGGLAGPLLAMRWTWTPGVVDPTVSTFAGIGCNNVKFDQASRLYIRGGSNGGGPNPVEMWAKLFNSTNDRKGTLELTVPNTAKWIVYEVLGYETLPRPQVQAFKVQVLDRQFEFARGDEVFLSWALAGDRGDAAALAALEQRVAALEALTD